MNVRMLATRGVAIALALLVLSALSSVAFAQTSFAGGLEITLLPGYKHEPLQGIDSIVGKIVNQDGVSIMFEIGPAPVKGAPLFGGSYTNQAERLTEPQREWFKKQTVNGQEFSIAYAKNQQLVVSTAFAKQGINLNTTAKTPADVADVLLMALTLTEKKPK